MKSNTAFVLFLFALVLVPSLACFRDIDASKLKCIDDSTCPKTHVCSLTAGQADGKCILRETTTRPVDASLPEDARSGAGGTSPDVPLGAGGTGGMGGMGGAPATGGAGGAGGGVVVHPSNDGGALLAAGAACKAGDECLDQFCVDGVCCKTKCDGACESCKESGSLGTCKVIHGDPVPPRKSCGGSGVCKGQCNGADGKVCAFPKDETTCTPATCTDGKVVTASVCNGAGVCTGSTSSTCATNQCASDGSGRCSGSCTASSCGTSAYCDSSGACVATLPNGKPCSVGLQCSSGICSVDGVCCNTTCDGQCESCKETGSLGTCKPVSGAPVGSRPACAGTASCKGACDGASGKACAFPTGSTECASATCSNGVVTPAAVCDGAGACVKAAATSCPYGLCTSDGRCAGDCTPGTKKCDGLVPSTCSSGGQWVAGSACDKLCSGGACSGTCVPNSKSCNGQIPLLCDAMATWQSGTACSNQACVDGVCTGLCAPGAKQCQLNGNGVQTCGADGTWGAASACNNQACVNGTCTGVCTPGTKQCSNNGVQTCSATGTWGTATACTNQACVNGACTGTCAPGANQCSGNGVQTCSAAGTWSTPSPCVNKACVSGACTGVCTPGTKQCSNNGVQTCGSNGTWGNPSPCTNQTCVAGACTGTCALGSKQCAGNNVQTCTASGAWSGGTPCGTQVCENGACITNTCAGTEGEWSGCRGGGCAVCEEKLVGYPRYLQNHPSCINNTTCAGFFATCNKACPAPTDADKDISECGGTAGQWSGCRGSGCHVCSEKVSSYPNYFNNHPGCVRNDTCAGDFYLCNYACPAPTDADR